MAAFASGNQTVGKIGLYAMRTDFFRRAEAWDSALESAEALNNVITNAQTISFAFAGEALRRLACT